MLPPDAGPKSPASNTQAVPDRFGTRPGGHRSGALAAGAARGVAATPVGGWRVGVCGGRTTDRGTVPGGGASEVDPERPGLRSAANTAWILGTHWLPEALVTWPRGQEAHDFSSITPPLEVM